MSRIDPEDLVAACQAILNSKPKKFVESIDLQFKLKNFDTKKGKRIAGNLALPYPIKVSATVCLFANAKDADIAKEAKVPYMIQGQLKGLKKDKKKVKELIKEYDGFIASKSLVRRIPRLVGPGLSRAGKFPSPYESKDDLLQKIDEVRRTIKFQSKKEVNLATPIGHMKMSEKELFENADAAIKFFASLCPKTWQNIETVTMKKTMGKPHRLYP